MNDLNIEKLCVQIGDKDIIKDLDLHIKSGEIHVIMGPNGTGKSTLSKVIMGHPDYPVKKGTITYNGQELNQKTVDERSRMGIFLGMQMPPEVEGVTNADFLRTAIHEKEGNAFHLMQFIKKLDSLTEKLSMNKDMIHRSINMGFSGGERKKNEILQMYMLKPSLVVLDEIDSGLDVDSLKIVGDHVTEYHNCEKPAILLITHYQRLLDYIKPDFVHIMKEGKIVKTGDASLVKEIEEKGYDFYEKSSMSTVEEV